MYIFVGMKSSIERNLKMTLLFLVAISAIIIPLRLDAATIKMGVVGDRVPENIVKHWTPLFDYLSREIGEPFEMVIREDYIGLVEALKAGEIDLFEGGAFSYVYLAERGAGEILVGEERNGSATYKSLFIVRNDSKYSELSQLKGARLALTDELSTSGYLVPRAMLAEIGINQPKLFFQGVVLTGSHERSIKAILDGAVDVAAVGDFFVDLLPPDQKENVRVIAQSEPVPTGIIAIKNGLNDSLKAKLERAFLEFKTKVPADMRIVTEVDSFIKRDLSDYDVIRKIFQRVRSLPEMDYAIPYRHIPTLYGERISSEKMRALRIMGGSLLLPFIFLICSAIYIKRFSTTIAFTMAGSLAVAAFICTFIQLIWIFSAMDTFAARKLAALEVMNLRAVAAVSGGRSDRLDETIKYMMDDNAIAWAKIFRNGIVIASDRKDEIGVSAVDQIRAGTYERKGMDSVSIIDPVIVDGRRFATLQVGISFGEVSRIVNRAIAINIYYLVGLVLIGAITTLIIRRKIMGPIGDIARAVGKLRDGGDVGPPNSSADIASVAESITRLGAELADKQQLLDLKDADRDEFSGLQAFELTNELRSKISEMESKNSIFRAIRTTCALGESPAWLRTLRDAAIRARDSDPSLVVGPTGSGKSGIVKSIHAISSRGDRALGEFNCAEFASGDPLIVLGKLFGYGLDSGINGIDRRGQKGILEEFDGCTLFLDEVELLPKQAQEIMLLPLEGRPFNPAAGKGGSRTTDVRFIFATNVDPEELKSSGKMRPDFLRRINSRGHIWVPPLVAREGDIEILARHFLEICNSRGSQHVTISDDAIAIIEGYSFDKYNVGELAGCINQAFDNASFEGVSQILPRQLPKWVNVVNRPEGLNAKDNDYDEEEIREISALRRTKFNISQAELILGYAAGSKTLTNHLRGIAYRALVRNGWQVYAAAEEIVGVNADKRIVERLATKLMDYIDSATSLIAAGSHDKVFNKLPQKYYPIIDLLIDAIKEKRLIAE